MALLHRFNSDDVFTRAISIGLLNLLSNNIFIWNRISDDEIKQIPIPFYYHSAGDERFMQDIFLSDTHDDCVDKKLVEGNIDVIPRGWIKLESCTINVATFTNRFVKGEYTVEQDNGELLTYTAPIIVIPLDINFQAEIKFDSQLDVMKGLQKVIETFYKVNTFKVLYNGMVIQVSASFPEDHTVQKTYEFSFGDDTTPTLEFSIAVETYFPVIDQTKKALKSNKIENFLIKSTPNTKSFPTYQIPNESKYVTKSSFTTDDSPQQTKPVLTNPFTPTYPEPVSPTGPFDPGGPDFTPSTVVKVGRNPDGSIGIPGTKSYTDSYGKRKQN